jgi:hypothetical protein
MRFVESCLLLAIGASLLGGCVPTARDPASPNRLLLHYVPGGSGLSIAFLPKDLELHPSTPLTVLILDPSNSQNPAFCRALLGNHNSLSSFLPQGNLAQDVRTILWFENRSGRDLRNADTTSGACPIRLDHFQFERARPYAQDFDLTGSEGPWLLSIDPRNDKSVLLDFSDYAIDDYDKHLAKWQKYVATNNVFWAQTQSRDLATVFLITEYLTEFSSGRLKIRIKGVDQSAPLRPK